MARYTSQRRCTIHATILLERRNRLLAVFDGVKNKKILSINCLIFSTSIQMSKNKRKQQVAKLN